MVKTQKNRKKASGAKQMPQKVAAAFADQRKALISQVEALVGPLCATEGVELVHTEYQRETAGTVLRLYIDKPGGVTLEDCADISRQVGDLLDIHIDHETPYHLEVSSPGTDRPLGKGEDFERFSGHAVRLKTSRPVAGQKHFSGQLVGFKDNIVKVDIDGTIVAIDVAIITKARLVNYQGEG